MNRRGSGGRRMNGEAVGVGGAAKIVQVAEREEIFGILLRVEFEARLGGFGPVVLHEHRAVRVGEDE